VVTVTSEDYAHFRETARALLESGIEPDQVFWSSSQDVLPFSPAGEPSRGVGGGVLRVPRAFATLAEVVACHREDRRWEVLYRLLWRIVREGSHVIGQEIDPDVRAARAMASQVRRDEHHMRAFLRFTPIVEPAGTRHVAWYEPDHFIVRRAAPFFADRFSGMTWSILTPDLAAHWDRTELSFSAGIPSPSSPRRGDEIEALWRIYYESMFNPARVNPRAMRHDMPARRWQRLPEATLIPELLSTAAIRASQVASTRTADTARPFVPATGGLEVLRDASTRCRGCSLHQAATRVVFGEGPRDAGLVLVGEQPGDAEDLSGRPFVGPAGEVLQAALAAARIERSTIYVTNAVKHFSFEPRGKRRIHQTPRLSEIQACRPWLEAELQGIRPATVVAMGVTAARALLGTQARVMPLRGRILEGLPWAPRVVVTVHPSAVLRNEADRTKYFDMLVSDLLLATQPSGGET